MIKSCKNCKHEKNIIAFLKQRTEERNYNIYKYHHVPGLCSICNNCQYTLKDGSKLENHWEAEE